MARGRGGPRSDGVSLAWYLTAVSGDMHAQTLRSLEEVVCTGCVVGICYYLSSWTATTTEWPWLCERPWILKIAPITIAKEKDFKVSAEPSSGSLYIIYASYI